MHARIRHSAASRIAVPTSTSREHLQPYRYFRHSSTNEIEKCQERYSIPVADHPLAWAAAFHQHQHAYQQDAVVAVPAEP